MRSVAVIPARIASTRLERKVLADICGKPMIQRTWDRVVKAKMIDEVVVATDSLEVLEVVSGWGGKAILTESTCQSGTERISSIIESISADLILNIQGDEPLVEWEMLDALVRSWMTRQCDVITPVYRIENLEELRNPGIVKVAVSQEGRALYFSRSPIPHVRDVPQDMWIDSTTFWGHVGVYGYRREVLARYSDLPRSQLQEAESLEQLRFLEGGNAIWTMETKSRSIAVDTQSDLERVRDLICKQL